MDDYLLYKLSTELESFNGCWKMLFEKQFSWATVAWKCSRVEADAVSRAAHLFSSTVFHNAVESAQLDKWPLLLEAYNLYKVNSDIPWDIHASIFVSQEDIDASKHRLLSIFERIKKEKGIEKLTFEDAVDIANKYIKRNNEKWSRPDPAYYNRYRAFIEQTMDDDIFHSNNKNHQIALWNLMTLSKQN